MYRMLCVLIATIACGTMAADCQAPQAGTSTITFQSSTYSDFRQLLAREAAAGTVLVRAKLDFPEEVRDRYPAVIVVHALGGYRDANEGYVAAELRKSGFATLTYDSFAARGTTGPVMSATPGYLPTGAADAYAALRWLSSEPRIDASRIAILGFSFGAEVAHVTAFESLRSTLNPGQEKFAAHVAFYPALNFGVVADRGAYTGSPVLLLLGGKDDNLPAAKVEGYQAYAASRGNSGPDRNRDLPGRLPCVDVSRPAERALLPGPGQREKMSADSARASPGDAAHRRSGKAVRPGLLRRVHEESPRVFDGV